MNGFEYYLKEGKPFNLYLHLILLKMKKVITIKMVVITVADKSKELSLNSLQEPFVYFSIQKAQPFTCQHRAKTRRGG
jgi:hypothetical protein